MRTTLFFLFLNLISQVNFAQPIGIFQNHADVGKPKNVGNTEYNLADDTYTLKGAGYNIWFNRDEFQYAYNKIGGDFVLTAQFEWIGDKGNNHRKYGWMIRESLDEAAAHVSAVSHGDGLTVMQWRVLRGAFMRDPEDEIFFAKKGFEIIQMERIGKQITMRVAHPGEPLQTVGSYKSEMRDSVFAGLYVCSHDSGAIEQVKVWNVRIEKPVTKGYQPEKQGFLSKQFETVTIIDGKRKMLTDSSKSLVEGTDKSENKKNALKNGKYIYQSMNTTGSPQIWRMKLDSSEKEQITFDEDINISPIVSPDGKNLGFISFPFDTGVKEIFKPAMIRVMPLTGGKAPRVITYYYGNLQDIISWSADSKSINFQSY